GWTGTGQLINAATDAAHLAEIEFIVLIEAKGGQAGIIAARVRPRTGGHDAQEDFSRGTGGFVQGPDFLHHVVAKNVFAAEIGREFAAAINVTANDGLSFTVVVIENGPFIDTNI